jgi:hypothetical protein
MNNLPRINFSCSETLAAKTDEAGIEFCLEVKSILSFGAPNLAFPLTSRTISFVISAMSIGASAAEQVAICCPAAAAAAAAAVHATRSFVF